MPTSHKTGLGLNAWVGSDCPMRQDFVDDNTLLDELISTHINNQEQHCHRTVYGGWRRL